MFNSSYAQKITQAVLVSLVVGSVGMSTQAVLATSMSNPSQPQSQTVPCKPDNSNCPWKKIKNKQNVPSSSTQNVVAPQADVAPKAGNPCKPSSSAAECRKWILGNPTPPVRPKK